jgi:hypothetical protein
MNSDGGTLPAPTPRIQNHEDSKPVFHDDERQEQGHRRVTTFIHRWAGVPFGILIRRWIRERYPDERRHSPDQSTFTDDPADIDNLVQAATNSLICRVECVRGFVDSRSPSTVIG